MASHHTPPNPLPTPHTKDKEQAKRDRTASDPPILGGQQLFGSDRQDDVSDKRLSSTQGNRMQWFERGEDNVVRLKGDYELDWVTLALGIIPDESIGNLVSHEVAEIKGEVRATLPAPLRTGLIPYPGAPKPGMGWLAAAASNSQMRGKMASAGITPAKLRDMLDAIHAACTFRLQQKLPEYLELWAAVDSKDCNEALDFWVAVVRNMMREMASEQAPEPTSSARRSKTHQQELPAATAERDRLQRVREAARRAEHAAAAAAAAAQLERERQEAAEAEERRKALEELQQAEAAMAEHLAKIEELKARAAGRAPPPQQQQQQQQQQQRTVTIAQQQEAGSSAAGGQQEQPQRHGQSRDSSRGDDRRAPAGGQPVRNPAGEREAEQAPPAPVALGQYAPAEDGARRISFQAVTTAHCTRTALAHMMCMGERSLDPKDARSDQIVLPKTLKLPHARFPQEQSKKGSSAAWTVLREQQKFLINHGLEAADGTKLLPGTGVPDNSISLLLDMFPSSVVMTIREAAGRVARERAKALHPGTHDGQPWTDECNYLTFGELQDIVTAGGDEVAQQTLKQQFKQLRYEH